MVLAPALEHGAYRPIWMIPFHPRPDGDGPSRPVRLRVSIVVGCRRRAYRGGIAGT